MDFVRFTGLLRTFAMVPYPWTIFMKMAFIVHLPLRNLKPSVKLMQPISTTE